MSVVRPDDGIDALLYDDTHGSADRPDAVPRSLLWYIGRGVSFGLLGLVALVAVLIFVVPAVTGSARFTTVAGPAETAIPGGALVVVHPTAPDAIGTGDVVAFGADGQEVATGRVAGPTVLAGGDTAFLLVRDAAHSPVPAAQVRGVVWYTIPGIGWATGMLSGPARAWVLPVVGVVLFGYAGWVCARAFLDRRRRRAGNHITEV